MQRQERLCIRRSGSWSGRYVLFLDIYHLTLILPCTFNPPITLKIIPPYPYPRIPSFLFSKIMFPVKFCVFPFSSQILWIVCFPYCGKVGTLHLNYSNPNSAPDPNIETNPIPTLTLKLILSLSLTQYP